MAAGGHCRLTVPAMIIDFHTHFYPARIADRALSSVAGVLTPATDGTRAGLLRSMKRAGIDRSLGLPLVNTPDNARGVNNWAKNEHHDEIIMLGSLHPDDPAPLAAIDFIADAGLPGIKLHPEYQNFRFSETRLAPIWRHCIERDLFVLTHAGSDIKFSPPFHSNPAELAAFHRQYPALKLVIAHFGGMDMWDEVEKELLGLPVYLDLAMIGPFNFKPDRLRELIRRHGVDRVIFGSDSPWADQSDTVRFTASLGLDADELDRIFYRNAAALLRHPELLQ